MISKSIAFSFRSRELEAILNLISRKQLTGYWKIQFDDNQDIDATSLWYLYLSRGRVVFSDFQPLSWSSVLETLKRYIPRLRSRKAQEEIEAIEQQVNLKTDAFMLLLLSKLTWHKKLTDYKEIAKAIQGKILSDFEEYLFNYAGKAEFIIDEKLNDHRPVVGFELNELITAAKQRQAQWKELRTFVPSLDYIAKIDTENNEWQNLTAQEKQQLQQFIGSGRSLQQISYDLGEDPLKVTKTFARLVQRQLIILSSDSLLSVAVAQPQSSQEVPDSSASAPEIFIVDDSPVLLKKFQAFATALGYRVRCCDNASNVVEAMLASNPVAIFLDVNMPEISGFQLVKLIRLQPKLASIPLIILTAEKTLLNQQRARWSKSKFLSKPLNPDEITQFESELRTLLQEIAPLNSLRNSCFTSSRNCQS
jgi:CheY-like chemotaxis protein